MTNAGTNRPSKATARIVGLSFLTATFAYMIGGGIVDSVLAGPDLLLDLYADRTRLLGGVLLQFVAAAANVVIGVLLFTILKEYSETIALGYVVTRIFDGAGLLMAGTGTLSLIALGRRALQAGPAEVSSLEAMASLIVAHGDVTFQVTMIVLGLGAVPFCYLLYRSRLVPRPLAALGIVGYVALFAGGVVELVGIDLASMQYVPGGIFELVLPFWLFFKGFDTTAAASSGSPAAGRATTSPPPSDRTASARTT